MATSLYQIQHTVSRSAIVHRTVSEPENSSTDDPFRVDYSKIPMLNWPVSLWWKTMKGRMTMNSHAEKECTECVQSSGYVRVPGGAGGQYEKCKSCNGTGLQQPKKRRLKEIK
jgi:DnaJ-class molecular chaperone